MRGLPYILSLFRNKFIKFNNVEARMLDYFYRIILNLLKNLILAFKCQYFAIIFATLLWTSVRHVTKSVSH